MRRDQYDLCSRFSLDIGVFSVILQLVIECFTRIEKNKFSHLKQIKKEYVMVLSLLKYDYIYEAF